jgi:hypothetical protein
VNAMTSKPVFYRESRIVYINPREATSGRTFGYYVKLPNHLEYGPIAGLGEAFTLVDDFCEAAGIGFDEEVAADG